MQTFDQDVAFHCLQNHLCHVSSLSSYSGAVITISYVDQILYKSIKTRKIVKPVDMIAEFSDWVGRIHTEINI